MNERNRGGRSGKDSPPLQEGFDGHYTKA